MSWAWRNLLMFAVDCRPRGAVWCLRRSGDLGQADDERAHERRRLLQCSVLDVSDCEAGRAHTLERWAVAVAPVRDDAVDPVHAVLLACELLVLAADVFDEQQLSTW